MKRCLLTVLLLLSVIVLSACVGPQYEQTDADKLKVEGQKKMTAWIKENVPGGKLIETENYIDIYPSGPRYLTDYITGTYTDGKTVISYAMNLSSGDVYVTPPENADEIVESYVRTKLSLPEEAQVDNFSFIMQLPYSTQLSGNKKGHDHYDFYLIPYGTEDLLAYLTEDREETVAVSCDVYYPSKDPLPISLKDLVKLRKSDKLYFSSLYMKNDNHDSLSITFNVAVSEGYSYLDYQDFIVYSNTYYKTEKYNEREDTIEIEENAVFDIEKGILFEETESGYRITYLDHEFLHQFRIIAKEDSRIRQHEYTVKNGIEEDSERLYDEFDVHWEKREDGNYDLLREDGYAFFIYQYTELEIR